MNKIEFFPFSYVMPGKLVEENVVKKWNYFANLFAVTYITGILLDAYQEFYKIIVFENFGKLISVISFIIYIIAFSVVFRKAENIVKDVIKILGEGKFKTYSLFINFIFLGSIANFFVFVLKYGKTGIYTDYISLAFVFMLLFISYKVKRSFDYHKTRYRIVD